jgi:hypothetical protein
LTPGQDFRLEIENAIRCSSVVLICLTKLSIQKNGFVQRELKFALDVAREQPEGSIFIIPARLEECELPVALRHLHWVNLYESQGMRRLVRALHKRAHSLGIATASESAQRTGVRATHVARRSQRAKSSSGVGARGREHGGHQPLNAAGALENDALLIEYLAKHLSVGRLAIILGSAIGRNFGLPDQITLLNRMFRLKGQKPPTDLDFTRGIECFRERCCSGSNEELFAVMQTALYKDISTSFEDLRHNEFLAAIAALVARMRPAKVSQLIALNCDDLLETLIEYHGLTCQLITSDRFWAQQADVVVYHPNGLFSAPPSINRREMVMLAASRYADLGDPVNLWAETISTVMRSHVCLFICVSEADMQLLEPLMTRNYHVHVSPEPFWGVSMSAASDNSWGGLLERRGIYSKAIRTDAEIPGLLFKIASTAHGEHQ